MAKPLLQAIAESLWRDRQDRWLMDLMSHPGSGFAPLTESILDNAHGEYLKAEARASTAAQAFLRDGNVAGRLRAETERLYARRRAGHACADDAVSLRAHLGTLPYPWLRIQLDMESLSCRNLAARMGAAVVAAESLVAQSKRAGYPDLYLRALGIASGIAVDRGLFAAYRPETSAALDAFWRGPSRGVRGQLLLLNLAIAEERDGRLYSAFLVRKEAAALLDFDDIPVQKALSLSRLGSAADLAGEHTLANQDYTFANHLFAGIAFDPFNSAFRYEAILVQAAAQAEHDDAPAALKTLEALSADADAMASPLVRVRLYQTLAHAYHKLNRLNQAERAYRQAIAVPGVVAGAKSPSWRGLASLRIRTERDWAYALNLFENTRLEHSAERKEALAKGESPAATFLVFASLPDGLAVWVSHQGIVQGKWLSVAPGDLQQMIPELLRQCSQPSHAGWEAPARGLYAALLDPVREWLPPGGPLVIQADGLLARIPFEVLVDSTGHALGERFTTAYADSVVHPTPEPSSNPKLWKALVVSEPTLTGTVRAAFPALRAAKGETDDVSHRFRAPRVVDHRAANVDAIRRWAPEANLIHFVGHGIVNAGNGGLLLAPENGGGADILDAGSLAGLRLPVCELVVLSACSTAAGELGGLPNPESLVKAFLNAGARRVLAARWSVDSQTTAQFMNHFYDGIQAGTSPPDASRRAALLVRNRKPHPYFWAGFQTFGPN